MVRQVIRFLATKKAPLLVLAALAVMLWHVLACVESPMAFSPNGKDLAFVSAEGSGKDMQLAGPNCYRLMVLSDRKDLRVLEQTTDKMLTAPAYSPDGSEICYLRLPLLTVEMNERLEELKKDRQRIWKAAEETFTKSPTTLPAGQNLTLPDATAAFDVSYKATGQITAELVIRRTSDFAVIKTLPLSIDGINWSGENNDAAGIYFFTHPQYSPDGKTVYLNVGHMILAVDKETQASRVLAVAELMALSPDGKTIAALRDKTIGFINTDGKKATYVRQEDTSPLSAPSWADNDMLVFVTETARKEHTDTQEAVPEKHIIHFMNKDGQEARKSITFTDEGMLELAIAPDGKSMVFTTENGAKFLDAAGKVVQTVQLPSKDKAKEGPTVGQPTFAPDSKSVAVRYAGEKESAIVFYTPQGKEITRVVIPHVKPGTTRPADQPATQPTTQP